MIKRITVYYDGACAPVNPGGACGWGFVVYQDGVKLHEAAGALAADPKNSNNVGEYLAVFMALRWLKDNGHAGDHVRMHGDSLLTVNQLSGRWKAKGGAYLDVYQATRRQLDHFADIAFNWIPREQNAEADALSKRELGAPAE